VAAPIVAQGAVVGFLHADCYYQGRDLTEADRAALALFGEGFGYALARTAVLDRLEALRADLGQLRAGLSSNAVGVWHGDKPGPETPRRLPQPPDIAGTGLTRREIDVLQWMARGETNGRIARRLSITEGTVKTHVQAILRKLNAANRAEAVSMWVQVARIGRER
jgi:DNA-binding CsgD family transcriptional regulator